MGKLVYLYGIILAQDKTKHPLPSLKGLDDVNNIHTIPFQDIEAVVCELDESDYNETALEEKTNQVDWLHKKALHHHETLMTLYRTFPIIPMKFCTIYESAESLANTILPHKDEMVSLLNYTADKEEWNVKIYVDQEKATRNMASSNEAILARKKETEGMSPGRQYLEKRKLDQLIEQEMDKEKELFASRINDTLAAESVDHEVKKNWNKDVTGRQEEMCWNSVYLVEDTKVDHFLHVMKRLREQWQDAGWILEASGPWPAYHFSKVD